MYGLWRETPDLIPVIVTNTFAHLLNNSICRYVSTFRFPLEDLDRMLFDAELRGNLDR